MSSNLNIEKIREEIATEVVDYIKECNIKSDKKKKKEAYVIMTFPGSGKTTSAMKAIDEAHYNWIYLAPFHDIIRENLRYSKVKDYDFIHLKGRGQPGVCLAEEYSKYAKMGISIEPFCESRCPLRYDGCPYYETIKRIENSAWSWAGVHSHISTYLQKFLHLSYKEKMMYRHYDVMIIDEFPFQVLFNQVIIQTKDLKELAEVIATMDASPEKDFVLRFLKEIALDISHVKIKSLLKNHRGLDLKRFSDDYNNHLIQLIFNKKLEKPPKNILFSLRLIHKENPEVEKLRWILYEHKSQGWIPAGIYITTSNVDYFRKLELPVVALDATADVEAWNTLLGRECKSKPIDIEYQNIYQMFTKARYPASSWISVEGKKLILSETGIKLCELIKEICNRKKKIVLLCSTKRVRRVIGNYLKKNCKKKNYQFAIYYNLRSRNKYYEDCDTCIVAHEPNIPPLQLEIMKNVIGWDEELLRELMTKSEMRQAIGRIRQNIKITPDGRKRNKIEIYILPGATKDEDKIVKEAVLVRYNDMMHFKEKGKRESMKSKVEELIKSLGRTTVSELYMGLNFGDNRISKSNLEDLLSKIHDDGKISDYRSPIKWVYDEKEAKRTKYKRGNS